MWRLVRFSSVGALILGNATRAAAVVTAPSRPATFAQTRFGGREGLRTAPDVFRSDICCNLKSHE